jgi:hypothetical protein
MSSINLNTVFNNLDAYSAKISSVAGGMNTRVYAFTRCLKQISETSIGSKILEKIKSSGKEILVRLNDQGNNSAMKINLTIHFDPYSKSNQFVIRNNVRQIGASSPAATLFHELVHIHRFVNEPDSYSLFIHSAPVMFYLDEEYDRLEEWEVIHGRCPDDFSENAFRKELGLPMRVTHSAISSKLAGSIRALSGQDSNHGNEKSQKESSQLEARMIRKKVIAENEEFIRGTLYSMVVYGLEHELSLALKRYSIRSSDFEFIAFNLELSPYFDRRDLCYDGVRENMLLLLLVHVIGQDASSQALPTKVFLKKILGYDAFSHDKFLKKLCRHLPLELILERTEILQKKIRDKNWDLVCDLIQEKQIGPTIKLWHPKKKDHFTLIEYASLCNWAPESIQRMQDALANKSNAAQ